MPATARARAHTGAARQEERQHARVHQPAPKPKAPAPKRLEARASIEIYAYIEHASAVSGRSLTDLMLAGTMREARDAIEQANVLKLSRESQMRFAEALLTPAKPNEALQKAAQNAARLIAEE